MVKDQACYALLFLLPADFLTYTAGLLWIEWWPLFPRSLLAHAHSPGTELTDSCYLLMKLMATPVSVLYRNFCFILYGLYIFTQSIGQGQVCV